jgi:cellulose synthase/poly-beta-1,6-N-acetylglucosamine synthase-like glycosyltransferase
MMTLLAVLSLLSWLWLMFLHGRFWQAGPALGEIVSADTPPVSIVVPARDEAALIGRSIGSLLAQNYRGALRVVLVDDGSNDGRRCAADGMGGQALGGASGHRHRAGSGGRSVSAADRRRYRA